MRPHDGKPISPYKDVEPGATGCMFVTGSAAETFTLSALGDGRVDDPCRGRASSATLKVAVKSVRAWPGGYRIANVNRTSASPSRTPTLSSCSRPARHRRRPPSLSQRLLAAKKGTSVTVTTAPAATKLDALLGCGLYDAATVVIKPS